jgi:hypothetical protein
MSAVTVGGVVEQPGTRARAISRAAGFHGIDGLASRGALVPCRRGSCLWRIVAYSGISSARHARRRAQWPALPRMGPMPPMLRPVRAAA